MTTTRETPFTQILYSLEVVEILSGDRRQIGLNHHFSANFLHSTALL
ncbi:MAG: hypothetical protein PUP93_13460 [Rhizonema sp. NSF051]|nr:hypothetical protein [Rhizonema sp. NSF051]